jgi:hypothetical protein
MSFDVRVRVLGAIGMAMAAAALCACAEAELGDGETDDRGGGESDPGDGDAPEGLRELLSRPTDFTIADAAGGSRASVLAVSLADDVTAAVELSILGGVVTLSLDDQDRVRFHDLLVDAEDVRVSPAIVPPDGLGLTELTMELSEPVSVQVGSQSDDELEADAELGIDVKWAVEVDHGVVNLAPIRLPALAFDFAVHEDGSGRLSVRLAASRPGTFWSWAGIFELRELEMELVADLDR